MCLSLVISKPLHSSRENLIGHVLAWPAEQVERCCGRIAEETHQISSHGITKVSSKLCRNAVQCHS